MALLISLIQVRLLKKTIISTILKNNKKLLIITIYAMRDWNNQFIPELKYIFEKLKLENNNNFYIIAGDFNARHTSWKNETNNNRGTSLHNLAKMILNLNYTIIQHKISFVPEQR